MKKYFAFILIAGMLLSSGITYAADRYLCEFQTSFKSYKWVYTPGRTEQDYCNSLKPPTKKAPSMMRDHMVKVFEPQYKDCPNAYRMMIQKFNAGQCVLYNPPPPQN